MGAAVFQFSGKHWIQLEPGKQFDIGKASPVLFFGNKQMKQAKNISK